MADVICKSFDYKKQLEEQRSLFLDCFPETEGLGTETTEHYMWKFQSFPSERKSTEYIACIDNEMVGYYACIPYRYQIDNEAKTAAMVCDVMTSSHHRGKGIFVKLGKYSTEGFAQEGYAFSTGYPIRDAVMPGHKKVGWTVAFDLPLYMKFIKTNSLLKTKNLGWLGWFGNIALNIYNGCLHKCDNKIYTIRVYHNIADIKDYDNFEKEWRKSVPNALIKDRNFAKWRYAAPGKKYWFFCAYKGDKMVGFLSARAIVKEGVPSFGIPDVSVIPTESNCLHNVYNALMRTAKQEKKEAVMMIMSQPDSKKYRLLSHGFLKTPFKFHFIFKKYDQTIPDEILTDVNRWHLMFVDSDDL